MGCITEIFAQISSLSLLSCWVQQICTSVGVRGRGAKVIPPLFSFLGAPLGGGRQLTAVCSIPTAATFPFHRVLHLTRPNTEMGNPMRIASHWKFPLNDTAESFLAQANKTFFPGPSMTTDFGTGQEGYSGDRYESVGP